MKANPLTSSDLQAFLPKPPRPQATRNPLKWESAISYRWYCFSCGVFGRVALIRERKRPSKRLCKDCYINRRDLEDTETAT